MFDDGSEVLDRVGAVVAETACGTGDDGDWMGVPPGLDSMQPGLFLALLLSQIDVTQLDGESQITVLRARQRMVSYLQAQMYGDMVAVRDTLQGMDPFGTAEDAAAAEIRAALRMTRMSADNALSFALDLEDRLPAVRQGLLSGVIDVARARVLCDETMHLPDAAAREIVDVALESAGRLTTGQLRARLKKMAIAVDPDAAQERLERAVEDRKVIADPSPSGTANLYGLDLPPDRVAAVMDRINKLALQARRGGETRSIDQLRADVFLDLLSGNHTDDGVGGVVNIHVDLATLTGLADDPGELAGYGPVVADIARHVADHQQRGEWRYILEDLDRQQVLATGVTRRRPTKSLRRYIEARDRTCRFPGCRMPATACDIDHTHPYGAGGPTKCCNLAPACRHDHRLKELGWTYHRLPNGDYLWTSPLGIQYTTSGHDPPA